MNLSEIIETLEGCGTVMEGILEERKNPKLQAVKVAVGACMEALGEIWEEEPPELDGDFN